MRLLFPPRCAACDVLLDWYDGTETSALCPTCERKLESEARETCTLCERPVSECLCVTELMRKAKCAAFVKLSYYQHGTRESVTNRLAYHVKEKRDRIAERYRAESLWACLRKQLADGEPLAVTYLPRTRRARAKYGTDQAEALARMLAIAAGARFERALLRSGQGEREQKTLSPAGRRRNAKTSFRWNESVDLQGCTVILVDDIVTTGASMAAGARLLRAAGAKRVICAAIASDDVNREPPTGEDA